MNIKKIFIMVLFSLAWFPLCALAENDDEGQICYEKGMRYWNKMQASEGELREAYGDKARNEFYSGANTYENPDCMYMAGEWYMDFAYKLRNDIGYFSKAESYFTKAERRYAEQLISAEDNGESIVEIEAKIKKAAQRAKDAKEAIQNTINDSTERIMSGSYIYY